MKLKLKKILLTAPVLLGLLVLSGQGCKGPTAEQQAAVRPVTLDFWTVYDDVDELRRMASEYKALRPYVTINIRQVRYDEFDELFVNALADDVGPDIISTHVRWLNKYKNRLATMPRSVQVANQYVKGEYFKETVVELQNVAMPSIPAIKSNFVSAVFEDVVIDDQVYGLPISMDTMAIYYNKDLLDQAGVPLAPTTWDEFEQAVRKSTKYDNNGNIVQSGVAMGTADNIDNSFDIVSLLMMQSMAGNGMEMVENGRVAFAEGIKQLKYEHPTMQALRFYTDFAQPTTEDYSWNEDMEQAIDSFTRGKTVFYFGFAHDRDNIAARAPQMEFEIIPVPQLYSQVPVNVANYWVQSVVEKSENKNLAWDFVRFITSQENIERYTTNQKLPSPLRAQVNDQKEDVDISPFANSVLVARNWYKGRDIDAVRDAFGDMVTSFLQAPGEEENALKRDTAIVERAAQVVQQTL
ncbi:MAG: extracellular solute-binding protein [Candidatus Magasanikbacteria bacterium]|nr:extracellular solute-binding protein [Candidatus Magasanikbacteria bacterium]